MHAERPISRSPEARGERAMDSRTLDAEKAEPAIHRAMLEGGSCTVDAEGRRRLLVHDPRVDAPFRSWPWPFRLIPSHRVRFVLYEDNLPTSTLTYEKKRIPEAIRYFLSGLPPRAKIVITRERSLGGGRR